MYTEKILEIHNVHRKSARNRPCKVKECWEMAMYAEKILRIVNVKVQECWEMAMYAERKCSESTMYTEKCSELSMQSGKMLGIIDARRKNTRNRQCTQKKYTESSMQSAKMLGNDKVC